MSQPVSSAERHQIQQVLTKSQVAKRATKSGERLHSSIAPRRTQCSSNQVQARFCSPNILKPQNALLVQDLASRLLSLSLRERLCVYAFQPLFVVRYILRFDTLQYSETVKILSRKKNQFASLKAYYTVRVIENTALRFTCLSNISVSHEQ
ncbi:Hypothetical predicted protein [Prunus dulcis]|uniref:Uncharacterized protein n=1 Tax=Prunus dulcis TaxID=3755 RepID=A0A5E4G2W3_PRUDU|nr:Hypothetical predicted protein [Prunus dulcis]